MKLKMLALGFAAVIAAATPAAAQRGPGGNWELLGQERVGLGADRDVVRLSHGEDYYRGRAYRRLRFVIDGGEVQMRTVRLVYLNGHAEDITVDRNLHPGENFDVDLRGERSYLRQIEMFYKGKFGFSIGGGGIRLDQATVRIYGENVRGSIAPPPPPPRPGPVAGPGWQRLDSARFDSRTDRVNFQVGRSEGRWGQIRFRVESGEADLREVRIRYANGETQVQKIDANVSAGEASRGIDIDGTRRAIETVTLILSGAGRGRPGEITLLGNAAPGVEQGGPVSPGPGYRPRPEWVPLGRQSVGFATDRDVIRLGHNEGWFRDRSFDKLHFVAEGNDVHMMRIRVVYLNGYGEDYRVDKLIRAGADLVVDLPGARSYIREIEMTYRSRPNFAGRATVSVYGEPVRRR